MADYNYRKSPKHRIISYETERAMNRRHMVQILAVMALSPTAIATKGAAQSDKREVISSAAGVQATVAPDDVVRIAWSRTDVPVLSLIHI